MRTLTEITAEHDAVLAKINAILKNATKKEDGSLDFSACPELVGVSNKEEFMMALGTKAQDLGAEKYAA